MDGETLANQDFRILAQVDVDDVLTLSLGRGTGVPLLSMINNAQGKRKNMHLSWIETGDHLSMKVKKEDNREYSLETMQKAFKALIAKATADLEIKSLVFRCVQILMDTAHRPSVARSESDCALIQENRRNTLWYTYAPYKGTALVHPSLCTTSEERKVLERYLEDGTPWRGIPLLEGVPATLRNMAFCKELTAVDPKRWGDFLILSQALLMGFRDWTGDFLFSKILWKILPNKDFRTDDESLNEILVSGREFFLRLVAYLRLYPVLNKIAVELVIDEKESADEAGFKRRDKFEMILKYQTSRKYILTRYISDAPQIALGMSPERSAPGEKGRLFMMPSAIWDEIVEACSLGGEKDPQFAAYSAIWAIEMGQWIERLRPCF